MKFSQEIEAAYAAYKAQLRAILTTSNPKLEKGHAVGWITAGIHFSPASLSGKNVCPGSSEGCREVCLVTAGHGAFPQVQTARLARTLYFLRDRAQFMEQLVRELEAFLRLADRHRLRPAVRLNLTSDLAWESIKTANGETLPERFKGVQFYDYTKVKGRMSRFLIGDFPANYHLTWSRSETPESDRLSRSFLQSGGCVAAVFAPRLPERWAGCPVIDGDREDLTFLRPGGTVFGLLTKGKAKADKSGFVIRV
jgi:hypothetical protein